MKNLRFLLLPLIAAPLAFAVVDPAQLDTARGLFKTPGKSMEAQAAFEKIAAADPSSAEAQQFLAQLAMRRNDADKAVAYAEKAVALAPDDAVCQHTLGDAFGNAA